MNKSALRNFAVWARRELIKRISDRANLLGVYENKPERQIQAETDNGFVVNGMTFNYKKQMRDDFIKRVKQVGYQDAIEEIAYTWFNRIVALRFMEVNGYLKNGRNGEVIYMIGSTTAGKSEPDAITYADKLSFVDKEIVYKYQDENKTNELYRYILTSQCNELNKVMPLMFEKIDNYVELLLPDHLLDNDAIISHLVNDISAKDFNITVKDDDGENASQVEIIGWLYQYYISEKKEDVFAGLKNNTKITKGTLPAATQIFTPDWIVRYMTDNTLGKMWVESRNSSLKKDLKYYLEPAEQTEDVKKKLDEINKEYARKNVKEITFIDPCCGSGHILVYAFEIFFKMYQESGYFASEIPALILKNNLFGIDVDKRAAQLTSFALTMKALSYDKDFLKKQVYPNVVDIKESNLLNSQELNDFIRLANLNSQDEEIVLNLVEKFKDAELYGSLIKDFSYTPEQYDILLKQIENVEDERYDLVNKLVIDNVKPLLRSLTKQAIYLSSKYDVLVTNPPYAGAAGFNQKLTNYLKDNYPNSKNDLYTCFVERCVVYNYANGLVGMITPESWFFLSSFSKLRSKFIDSNSFEYVLHLGLHAFDCGFGTATYIFRTNEEGLAGKYIRLVDFSTLEIKLKNLNNKLLTFHRNMNDFKIFPNSIFAYWCSDNFIKIFKQYPSIGEYFEPESGIKNGKNEIFLRYWYEVSKKNTCFDKPNLKSLYDGSYKWYKCNKAGGYKKWYGLYEYVLNMYKNGQEIKKTISKDVYRLRNENNYFKEALTWPQIGDVRFSCKYLPEEILNDAAANSIYFEKNKFDYDLIALFNSKCFNKMLQFINPTVNYPLDTISSTHFIPVKNQVIEKTAIENINISKLDWDEYETSWDFKENPLQIVIKNNLLKAISNLKSKYGDINIEFNKEKPTQGEGVCITINRDKIYIHCFDMGITEKIADYIANILETKEIDIQSINLYPVEGKQYPIGYSLKEIAFKNLNIGNLYEFYKNEVNARFDQLKRNEEELNRIFIEIYGLQDELTPDVADKDITVTRIYDKKEDIPEEMKNNIYVRTKQDIVKDLISYIVGCAFGRYSPYRDGLQFAGGDFNWDNYFNLLQNPDVSIIKNIKTVKNSFLPNDENCIVNTDNDYVEFSLVDRVVEFISVIFGQSNLEENLRFIANALDEKSNDTPRNVIREYLANDFFKDHCKKYQNRPIYWQFDSGKNGGFRALMYLHRYDLNTIPTARLSYLHDIQWKYEHEKDRLEQFIEKSNITAEKAKAKKELDLINKQILECKAYDEILNHASNMNIQIDLDDGVKVNYQKFQKLDGDKDKNIFSTYLKF